MGFLLSSPCFRMVSAVNAQTLLNFSYVCSIFLLSVYALAQVLRVLLHIPQTMPYTASCHRFQASSVVPLRLPHSLAVPVSMSSVIPAASTTGISAGSTSAPVSAVVRAAPSGIQYASDIFNHPKSLVLCLQPSILQLLRLQLFVYQPQLPVRVGFLRGKIREAGDAPPSARHACLPAKAASSAFT